MPRPSVVLDTNVVVSAHLREDGLERFVLDLALAHKLSLSVSAEILEEYRGVLSREKFRLEPKRIAASLRLIEQAARMVRPKRKLRAANDPDSNKYMNSDKAQAVKRLTGNT